MNPILLHPPDIEVRDQDGFSDEEFADFVLMHPDLRLERTSAKITYTLPPPFLESSFHESRVSRKLGNWSDKAGGEVISPAGMVFLPNGACYFPDAGWMSPATLADWRARGGRTAKVSPDFVVEIRSESDRLPTLQAKMADWIDGGVRLAWLLDPIAQQAWVYRPGQPQPQHYPDFNTPLSGEDVLPGFVFDLQLLVV